MENTKRDISEDTALSGESYHLQRCKSRQRHSVHSDGTAAQTENSPHFTLSRASRSSRSCTASSLMLKRNGANVNFNDETTQRRIMPSKNHKQHFLIGKIFGKVFYLCMLSMCKLTANVPTFAYSHPSQLNPAMLLCDWRMNTRWTASILIFHNTR